MHKNDTILHNDDITGVNNDDKESTGVWENDKQSTGVRKNDKNVQENGIIEKNVVNETNNDASEDDWRNVTHHRYNLRP